MFLGGRPTILQRMVRGFEHQTMLGVHSLSFCWCYVKEIRVEKAEILLYEVSTA